MAKIIGNTTATPNPRPDWNQTDETKADYIKNKPNVANAISGTASGEVVAITDVSPIKHTMDVRVTGIDNPENVTVARCGKNISGIRRGGPWSVEGLTVTCDYNTQEITINGTYDSAALGTYLLGEFEPIVKKDDVYTLTVEYISGEVTANEKNISVKIGLNYNKFLNIYLPENGKTTETAVVPYDGELTIGLSYISGDATFTDYKFRIQLEVGDTATEYESYTCLTYTPNADGTVEGVTSLYPNTTLLTDSGAVIECEYNKDINKALDNTSNVYTKEESDTKFQEKLSKDQIQSIDNISNKVDRVDGKDLSSNDYTTIEKNKLAGIAESANNYILPQAGKDLGGVKSGGNVIIEGGIITVNDNAHNHTIDNINELQNTLNDIESIAKGRATGYVFDTKEDMDAWLVNNENVANLVLGDNLYIRATDVPDYWWDGTEPHVLETQKVDLTEYAKTANVFTKSQTRSLINSMTANKADVATTLAGYGIIDTYTQEEVDTELDSKSDKDTVSNAIKDNILGTPLVLVYISPIKHNLKVKTSPETLVYSCGQNVWDEEVELVDGGARIGSKNYIKVQPYTDYYLYCNSPVANWEEFNSLFQIFYYDYEKQELTEEIVTFVDRNSKITIPENCHYIKFWLQDSYGNTYKNDICINISDENINGTYVPYQGETSGQTNEDGIVDGIKSFYPVTSLYSNRPNETIECEYNLDTNQCFRMMAEEFGLMIESLEARIAVLEEQLSI